jgi:hypothetical protein
MPTRFVYGTQYIRKAPCRHTTGEVPVRITKINSEHLNFWDSTVQPEVDKDLRRADRGWQWPKLVKRNATLVSAIGQKPLALAFGIERTQNDEFIPVALLLVVTNYPALHVTNKKSVFIWYMSSAPRKITESIVGSNNVPSMVCEFCIDTVITVSINRRLDGLIGLHAAPLGGAWLCQRYLKTGLLNLDPNVKLPGIRRFMGNDGRYFYTDMVTALSLSQLYDRYR